MKAEKKLRLWTRSFVPGLLLVIVANTPAQEKLTVSYAALGGANGLWNIAKEAGFYKKHGLDVDVVFIGSSTISAAAVLSGHIQIGMVAGSGVINAAASGADLISVACFVNVLDFDLVVPPSIKSAADLKGKSIGISRFGSVTDAAARAFLSELKLRPGEDVAIRQIGGIPERATAFKHGVVDGYLPASGGIHLLGEALPHNVLLRMGDLKNPPPFPFICAATTKGYLARKKDNVKKVVMALTEATHHFKTNKENTKKIIGKFFPTANAAYLEDNYAGTAKILERVPYVSRPGMENLIVEARKTNPSIKVTVNDVVDDTIVRELEREAFFDRVYGKK